jgi:hypothetical protein
MWMVLHRDGAQLARPAPQLSRSDDALAHEESLESKHPVLIVAVV